MAMQSNPPAKADEKSNQEIYAKAAEALGALFGTPSKPGIFNQQPLPAGFTSRAQFVRSILDAEGNRAYLSTMPQPHTSTLATVMAARGNPLFPADLVVEFVARPNEGDDDYDDSASRIERLRLLAEIASLTRDPATGNSRVALKLPFNGHLDFRGAVVSIFDALDREEMEKLGLDKVESGGGFREFAADLDGVVGELAPRTLTPMQRFYLRAQQWAEQREAARMERDKRRGQRGERGEDAASALPQVAAPKTEPAPAPVEPVIPNLSALTGGESAPTTPVKVSRANKKAAQPVAVPAAPVVALPATAPTAEEPAPAAASTVADEDRELVLAAIKKVADGGNAVAKAFLALKGEKATLEEMAAFAIRKGLL